MILTDTEAYQAYPNHRKWFNRLWLSEQLGYVCGPHGIAPPSTGWYIVKPIYNLYGMGAGAKIKYISQYDVDACPPGYFWCETFEGEHLSIDYSYTPLWGQHYARRVVCGEKFLSNKLMFKQWIRTSAVETGLPSLFDELYAIPAFNVEMIGGKIIEVHLRPSNDPFYKVSIPIYDLKAGDGRNVRSAIDQIEVLMNRHEGSVYIPAPDNAGGWNKTKRVGFVCYN